MVAGRHRPRGHLEDGQRHVIAVAVNYSSHPTVLDSRNTLLSGDYAGIGMAALERRFWPEAVALFLQGCAGDTGTHTFRHSRTIPEAERLGQKLADEAWEIVQRVDVTGWARLAGHHRMVTLPQKALDRAQPPTLPPLGEGPGIRAEVQVLVIGEAVLVAVGSMEAYVEIGLAIKRASPFRHTFTLAYANGPWLGYLPSPHGYAIDDPDARLTPFAPQAPHVLVKEALALVRELVPS